MKRRWLWVKIGIAVVLVVVAAVQFLDLGRMGELLLAVSIPFLLATVAASALDQTLMGWKWNFLLKTFGIDVPARVPILAYWRGRLLRLVAPSILGLDAYRAYYLKQHGAPLVTVLSSIFVERSLGILSSLGMISLLAPFALGGAGVPVPPWLWPLAVAGFATAWGFVWLSLRYAHVPGRRERIPLLMERFQKPCLSFLKALEKVKGDRRRVYLYYLVSNAEKLLYGTCVYFAARAVGVEGIGWLYLVAAVPVVALLERLPISFQAIGVREGLYVVALQPFDVDPNVAVAVGLVVRAAEILLILMSFGSWIPGRRGRGLRERIRTAEQEMASA